jgi:hypothetical protein
LNFHGYNESKHNFGVSTIKEKGANPLPAYIYIKYIYNIVFIYLLYPSAGMVDSANLSFVG